MPPVPLAPVSSAAREAAASAWAPGPSCTAPSAISTSSSRTTACYIRTTPAALGYVALPEDQKAYRWRATRR
ncbi:hypothetical protein N658DRAFT_500484 [Parathielavia hyrcaniae]|uniref:Uncharacterized protein n=1 Tax=Parathielavia hyrcaniae TaxID=113614 RepID=A0AAN6PVI9_9PEZI|nr:hypothetical protein N658DRAFT_500484 [Parathielavia hyrcaniae]